MLRWREIDERSASADQRILGMVETIVGGFVGGDASNNTRKRHLRVMMSSVSKKWKKHYEPIYFTKEDFGDIKREHDDPMVISALIHNLLVKRVLID